MVTVAESEATCEDAIGAGATVGAFLAGLNSWRGGDCSIRALWSVFAVEPLLLVKLRLALRHTLETDNIITVLQLTACGLFLSRSAHRSLCLPF